MKKILLLTSLAVLPACLETSSTDLAASRTVVASGALSNASALELAQGYEASTSLLVPLEFAEMGGKIVTQGGEITARNAALVRQETEERIALFGQEIERRGYVDLSGRYRAQTTEACSRIPSWISFIPQGATSFEFRQSGFEFDLLQKKPSDSRANRMTGVVAESSFAFKDSLNSGFRFNGTASGRSLVVKPDPSVLQSWPDWAGPPSRRDIISCTVTFTKL